MKKIRKQIITSKTIIPLLLISLALIFSFTMDTVSAQFMSPSPNSSVIYVNGSNGSDDNDGLSWETAKLSIKNATGTVNINGTVYIANGTYTGIKNTNILIDKNMAIVGQNQTGTIIDAQNSGRIFYTPYGAGVNITLSNLTLRNGNSGGSGSAILDDNGLGVYSYLNITNCTFENNHASGWGGAIYGFNVVLNIVNSSFTGNTAEGHGGAISFSGESAANMNVTGSTFTNNNADGNGGAIYNGADLTIKDSNFTGNTAPSTSMYKGNGGAIDNSGNLAVIDSAFTGNTARWTGGAIESSGALTVTGSTFTDNSASHGGAIHNYQGILNIASTTFTGNTVIYNGGAIHNQGTLNITGSTFTDNAASQGGAIFHYQDTAMITGSTFTGNSASYSGGAINGGGTCTVIGSTFTGNTANDYGGAILNYDSLTVTGSTFTGNTAIEGGAIINTGTCTVTGSTFTNNTAVNGGAICNYGTNTCTVTGSTFTGNKATAGIGGAIYTSSSLTAHFNRFYNNTAVNGTAIYCYSGSVDAENNWWGSNNPYWNSLISGFTNPTNWVILTVTVNPTNINNTQTSAITADFNHINGGGDLIGGHIPDGPITLSIPWGSFTSFEITHSVTLNTVNGVMTSMFYANEGAVNSLFNPVQVTATADNYTTNNTESAYIRINKTADLYLNIISSNNNPQVRETFTLTYKLGNKGPDNATNVTMTIPLPEGFEISQITGDGNWTYNANTNTITWTLNNVPVGDPYLYISGWSNHAGTFVFSSSITSDTYNINTEGVTPITINAVNEVKAASKTIPMQKTGLPIAGLILAILAVLGGLATSKRK